MAVTKTSADLFDTMIQIAAAAPKKPGQYVSNAGIPWRLITELRETLDDLGIEWRNGG